MKYVISAINVLTGEREAISAPRSLESANKLMEKFLKNKEISKQPWKNPRLDPSLPEETDE